MIGSSTIIKSVVLSRSKYLSSCENITDILLKLKFIFIAVPLQARMNRAPR
ncbi:MAG: hypothetical protein ACD_47C00221G0006 [uncultured bacterium]|nr:MAG: hypothetical protein ACD_47C00221G0006 [uncultured bacterium]